jgi:hypothetical protein
MTRNRRERIVLASATPDLDLAPTPLREPDLITEANIRDADQDAPSLDEVSPDEVNLDDTLPDVGLIPKVFGNLANPKSHSGYPLWLGAVHVAYAEGPELTVQDRQIWTYLVALAYETMNTADDHRVTYRAIREQLAERMEIAADEDGNQVTRRAIGPGHDSYERIKDSVLKLMKTIVVWDVFKEDKRSEKVFSGQRFSQLLGSGGYDTIDAGNERMLVYSFPLHLRPLLGNPQTYSYLRTRVVFSFTSIYALRLYEALQRHADRRIKPWRVTLDIPKLRLLLGIKDGQLEGFARIKQRALDPALEQINAFAEFDVDYDVKRGSGRGAPVTEITLTVRAKSETAAVRALYDADKVAREKSKEQKEIRRAEKEAAEIAEIERLNAARPAATSRDGEALVKGKRRSKFTPAA